LDEVKKEPNEVAEIEKTWLMLNPDSVLCQSIKQSSNLFNSFANHLSQNLNAELVYSSPMNTYIVVTKTQPDKYEMDACYKWLDHIRTTIYTYERAKLVMHKFDLSMIFNCRQSIDSDCKIAQVKENVSVFQKNLNAEISKDPDSADFGVTFKKTKLVLYGQIKPCTRFKEQVVEPYLKQAHKKLMKNSLFSKIRLIEDLNGNFLRLIYTLKNLILIIFVYFNRNRVKES
jgi:hypothetical protein